MRLSVTVKAGARRRAIEEADDGTLRIRTPVAPEKGKANADVVDMLAEHFHVPRSSVTIVRGHGSSRKIIEITA